MITLEALDSNNVSFLNKRAWVEQDAKMLVWPVWRSN
jgi:hypothetical protein